MSEKSKKFHRPWLLPAVLSGVLTLAIVAVVYLTIPYLTNVFKHDNKPITTTVRTVKMLRTSPYSKEDLVWLARNIYFEARGEPDLGQYAVAWVTMHRLYADAYPNTIKEVVTQRSSKGCQFEWVCTRKNYAITHQDAWDNAVFIASQVLQYKVSDPVVGAEYFHVPAGSADNQRWVQIGRHVFSVRS